MNKILLFDWGNTIMVDFDLPGPMYTWEKVAWVKGAENAMKTIYGNGCCIATNAGESNSDAVRKALARIGADIYFTYIFTSWDFGFEKPDIRFFQFIIRKFNGAPTDFIMIGDNYKKDIEGAKSSGMNAILFNPENQEGPFPLADWVITDMNQLPSIIERL
jgi:putative hydrolase of the HAD superfamily